jgi:hypothetical protein
MTENRAVAGAAQSDAGSTDEPTPARWLDQPEGTVLDDVLPVWLPGLTRHQQADAWLRAEEYVDRGDKPVRGAVAAEILVRKFQLLGAVAELSERGRIKRLTRLEAQTTCRPAVIGALNHLAKQAAEPEPTTSDASEEGDATEPEADPEPAVDETTGSDLGEAFDQLGDADDPHKPPSATRSAVATDGGDDPADCPDCGAQRRPDHIDGQDYWYCTNCEEGEPRETAADVGVKA